MRPAVARLRGGPSRPGGPENERVEAIDPAASAAAFNRSGNGLLAHECFALARADARFFSFDFEFGVEVHAFWDSGGREWLGQYLALAGSDAPNLWVRPSPRTALTRQTHPDHPLNRFVCSAELEYDPCTPAVAGWRHRASRYFEPWATNPKDHPEDCLELAQRGPAREAYARWRDCEAERASVRSGLPLGGLGVVDRGWIVVRGRRGTTGFAMAWSPTI